MLIGRGVEPEIGRDLLQVEPADAAGPRVRRQGDAGEPEVELQPGAPLAGLQEDLAVGQLDDGRIGLPVAMDEKIDGHRPRAL